MTNSIEPIDDSCGRFMGRLALLIEPSVNSPYIHMTPKM